ncbi:MAG: acyl-CoA dehydrogenase family protein [Rhodobacteraceae bacterium]|jgi:alkylation response protein AidB-like acyl-CoA dehydrogenase|nr:acyl-CoA dehydrogenase family protein [Paracoccaceae bacterium]
MSDRFFPGDDAAMLKQSLNRLLAQHWGSSRRRETAVRGGFSPELWRELAQAGILASFHPEECGGAGGGGHYLRIVMESVGWHRVLGPFIDTLVVTPALLANLNAGPEIVARCGTGEEVSVLAWAEPGSRNDLTASAVRAAFRDGAIEISGDKVAVPYAVQATNFLVSAALDQGGRQILALVPATSDGVCMVALPQFDGSQRALVSFDHVRLDKSNIILEGDAASEALARARTLSMLARCAETVGLMERLLALTIDHVKVRRQFGSTIGSNQAIQHRMVDLFTACQMASAYVQAVMATVDGPHAAPDHQVACQLKLHIDKAARSVAHESVQLHGGMGVSEEHEVGSYLRRIIAIAQNQADEFYLYSVYREAHRAL